MIKHFCDCCGEEITDRNKATGGSVGRIGCYVRSSNAASELFVEVITAKDKASNTGDFCKYCIIDAINSLDDRTRLVQA